jgi:predicted GNAT family N-acyltransferase
MISVVRFRSSEQPFLARQAVAIRHEVFVKGQNVNASLELEFEEESNHYLLLLEEQPVATARWRRTDKGIKLERFATLPEHRNKGFGSMLLDEIMKEVRDHGERIYLHAQLGAVRFYEKHGFVKEGEMFYEANIGHYRMAYEPFV